MITRLHHAQITIPKGEEEKGKQFYCNVLGLEEIEKPDVLRGRGGFWLAAGSREVHVGTEADVDRMATKAHLAYQVDDLSYWRTRLEEHNVEIIEAVAIPGYERFEFRDLFGNRVEMIQREKSEAEEDFFKQVLQGMCRTEGISARKPRFKTIERLVVISMKNHYKDGVDPECFMILNFVHQLVGRFGIKFTQNVFLYPDSNRVARIDVQIEKEQYDWVNWQMFNGMED